MTTAHYACVLNVPSKENGTGSYFRVTIASRRSRRAAVIIAHSIGDAPFRVCSMSVAYFLKIFDLLDEIYASKSAASRISTMKAV